MPECKILETFFFFPHPARLNRSEVKVKFLHAGDRRSVLGRGAKGPGLEGSDHAGFNTITKGMQNRKICDLAARVDGYIDHHIPLHPVGED